MENAGLMSWHVERSEEEIAEMKELAEQGNAAAQTEYGKCLLFGKGVCLLYTSPSPRDCS